MFKNFSQVKQKFITKLQNHNKQHIVKLKVLKFKKTLLNILSFPFQFKRIDKSYFFSRKLLQFLMSSGCVKNILNENIKTKNAALPCLI